MDTEAEMISITLAASAGTSDATAGAQCQGAQDPSGEIEKFQTAIWSR
jgi:hypothetical protein